MHPAPRLPVAHHVAPPGANAFPQAFSGSSFAVGTFSMYIYHANFVDVLSWMLQHRDAQYLTNGMDAAAADAASSAFRPLDFLIHPCMGCNFADHELFSMHAGFSWPANRYGLAQEGGYGGSGCPSLDEACATFGPSAVQAAQTCAPSTNWSSYTLALPRDASDTATAAACRQDWHV